MLNAQELISQVCDMSNEPFDKTTKQSTGRWDNDQMLLKLSQAQSEVSLKVADLLRAEDSSIAPVPGQGAYTLPADIGKVYQVWINGQPIDSKGADSLAKDYAYSTQLSNTGMPVWYSVQNNTLNLYPIPDASVTTIKVVGELLLTSLTDSSTSYPFDNIPYLTKAQKILTLFAAADCVLIDGDTTQYSSYRSQGEELLGVLEADWEKYRTPETHSIIKEKVNEDSLNRDTYFGDFM